MMTPETLLAELGKNLGLPGLQADSAGFCCVQLGEDLLVNLIFSADKDRLTVFSQLGVLDPTSHTELMAGLLAANFFWRGSGGATFGWDEDSGAVVLALEVNLQTTHYSAFETRLDRFVEVAQEWYQKFQQSEQTAVPPSQALPSPALWMRV